MRGYHSPINLRFPPQTDKEIQQAFFLLIAGIAEHYAAMPFIGLTSAAFLSRAHPVNQDEHRYLGVHQWDTTGGIPLWWNGAAWVNSAGAVVYTPV